MKNTRYFDDSDIGKFFIIDDKNTLIGKLSMIGFPIMVRKCKLSGKIQLIHFSNGKYLRRTGSKDELKFSSNGGRIEYILEGHPDYDFYNSQLEPELQKQPL